VATLDGNRLIKVQTPDASTGYHTTTEVHEIIKTFYIFKNTKILKTIFRILYYFEKKIVGKFYQKNSVNINMEILKVREFVDNGNTMNMIMTIKDKPDIKSVRVYKRVIKQ
jgi:hypothetical protein